MKLNTKFNLAQAYNRPSTVVVVASYPGKSNRSIKDIDAVASYTDHFADSYQKELAKSGKKLIIIAQKNGNEDWYEEKGMLICRVWDKGSPFCFVQIIFALLYFKAITSILVQFEFHQFGGNLTTLLFPFFLFILKAAGKVTTLVMHQVVPDITDLAGHLNITPHTIRAFIFNTLLIWFYKIVSTVPDSIIVHNEILKQRFAKLTGRTDSIVIPHGLGAIKNRYKKEEARKLLGFKQKDTIIMSFGFLTWYKGADWLVREWSRMSKPKHWHLVMAGGESPNLKSRKHYQAYVKKMYDTADKHTDINITGFVEDKNIPLYFAAADIVVLPYRTIMSSSGPLAMAIAFKKPFLLSKALGPYVLDKDFSQALQGLRITKKNLLFDLTGQKLVSKIKTMLRSTSKYARLSRALYQSRSWSVVASQFDDAMRKSSLAKETTSVIMHRYLPVSYASAQR